MVEAMPVYIALPYSHEDQRVQKWRYQRACRAAAKLVEGGIAVYSPLATTLTAMDEGLSFSHGEYLDLDVEMLRRCDEL